MSKLKLILFIALTTILSGCAHYEIDKNAPLTLGGRIANSLDKTGRMSVDFFNNRAPEYFQNKDGLYVLTFKIESGKYSSISKYELRGVDSDFEQKEYLSSCGGVEACRNMLVRVYGLSKFNMKQNPAGIDIGHSIIKDVYLMAKVEKSSVPTVSSLTIEYNDYSASSKKDFQNAQSSNSVGSYTAFLKKFPQSILVPIATRELIEHLEKNGSPQEYLDAIKGMPSSLVGYKELTDKFFENHFTAKIETTTSSPRPITEKALLTSMAGACVDITKKVTITPRMKLDFAKDVSLDLTFTLIRTYTPHQLAEDGDPLLTKKAYVLNKNSGFVKTDVITYPCVLSAGRFHAAGLSLIGKLLGKSNEKTGINTTLTKTKFDMKVERAR